MNTLLNQSKNLVLALMFISTAAFAQQEVTDAELGNFAKAVISIQEINMEAQNTMMAAVTESGISLERFNQLYEASMMEDEQVLSTMTEEESEKMDSVMARFEAMYAVFEKQMEAAIVKENITIERFEAIAGMMESDFALQMRLQSLMEQ
jgi:ribosomal protein S13